MDFKSAEEKFQSIENAFHSGRLSDHDYQAAVSQISVQDEAGRQWKIQPYSGQWHVYDWGGWHPARRPQPQVNTGHRPTQQRPVQPNKRKKPWIYVGGCALLVAVVVCVIGGLGMFGIISLGFIEEDSLERHIIQTQDFVLDGIGGVYQMGAMTLEIGPNNLGQQLLVKLTEYDMPLEAGITDQTSLFRLEGLPAEFRGELHTRINLTQSLLDTLDRGDAEAAKSLTFYLGSYSYATSVGDLTFSMVPVEVEIDLVMGQASTVVQFGYGQGQVSGNVMASMIMPAGVELVTYVSNTENDVFFIVINDGGQEQVVSDHFVIHYPSSYNYEQVLPLLDQLEWVYQDLMAMGWAWPIDYQVGQSMGTRLVLDGLFKVYIQDCDPKAYVYFGRTTGECSGLFKDSIVTGVHVLIHPRTLEGDVRTMKATVGHELMHAAQYAFHIGRVGRSGFSSREKLGLDGGADSWKMLDEAVATWYEQRAAGDDNLIPGVASLHADFYTYPWFFDRDRKTAEHAGYGASWFIHYLVRHHGANFILEAYKAQHTTGGGDALIHGLQVSGVSQSLTGTLFPGFLDDYFLETHTFAHGLSGTNHFQYLSSRVLSMGVNRRRLTFNPTGTLSRSAQVSTSPGTIVNLGNGEQALSTPATVTVTATLPASMTAYYFHYDVPSDGASWQEGQVITINSSGGAVLVFGDSKDDWLVEYANVSNPLDDIGRRELTIDATEYHRFYFILFNDSPLSNSVPQDVSVTIKYGQEGVEPIVEQQPVTTGEEWLKPGTYKGGIGWFRPEECFGEDKHTEHPFSVTITRVGDQYYADGELIGFSRNGVLIWTVEPSHDYKIRFEADYEESLFGLSNVIRGSFSYYFLNDEGNYYRTNCYQGWFSGALE